MRASLNASLHDWCRSQTSVHIVSLSLTDAHTCKHTCRVWAVQHNKQHGSNVVSFAPCAIVEKPHEGFWVLKDKPWLAGRESVMQQENCIFHPPPPSHFISIPLSLYSSYQVLYFTKLSLSQSFMPSFFSTSPFLSLCGILDSVVILPILKRLDHRNVPSKRWVDLRGRDKPI